MKYTIKYYIDIKNDTGYINLFVSVGGKRIKKSLGITFDDLNIWDKKEQRFKKSSKKATEYNEKLRIIKTDLESKFNQMVINKSNQKQKISLYDFQDIIDNLFNINSKSDVLTTIIDEYLKENESKFKLATKKNFKVLKNHLNDFKPSIKASDFLNEKTVIDFRIYLQGKTKRLNNNSLGKIFREIKTILNYCVEHEIINSLKYRKLLQSPTETNKGNIALSQHELNLIIKHVPTSMKLTKCKDLFLIQCFTGIRYSDLINLKPENINYKENLITLTTIKTESTVEIPIHSMIKEILQKYKNYKLFSSQKYNEYLKVLCKQAGIIDKVETVSFFGNERSEKIYDKFDLVSSHTARRTFITLGLQKGLLPEEIMNFTGHSNRKSFDKYVRPDKKQAQKKFLEKF